MTASSKHPSLINKWPAWLAGLLAILGVAVYLAQAAWFARTSISSLDEGAYLYKGMLFATQAHHPFELFGIQTNKAPLAFLIPGYVESIFGSGLRTGRWLAVLFGSLSLVAVWMAARRLGGKWLAAAAVWALALSPAVIKIDSQGVTQSSVAFLLALILALSLGENRPRWQLILAGFLSGALIMLRQNMLLVLPLLVLYIGWQNGWKPALYSTLAGGLVLIFFHVLYWPYIMQLWTPWLPAKIALLFAAYVPVRSGVSNWDPSVDMVGRLLSFFQGVRFHFVAMTGMLIGLFLWPKRRAWVSDTEFRAAVFLAALFAGLLLMHSWASISNDYCVFCFTPYVAFFNVSAILFLVIILCVLERDASPFRQGLLALIVLVIFTGVGFSAFEDIGDSLLAVNIPRVSAGHFQPGLATLGDTLSNKFSLERNTASKIVSAAAGGLVGLFFLLSSFIVKRWKFPRQNYGYTLAVSVLICGLLVSPLLSGSAGRADCPAMDVVAANEQLGAYLAKNIPAGSQIYWNGGLSVAPLLYAPDIQIYLPQINDGYAYTVGGDAQALLKYGFWNDALSAQWLREADYVVVEGWRYADMKAALPPSTYDELPRSPTQASCLDGSGLRIFQRK
jgi:4-amino-4-deoxy-L-arabinose transferase-like glycosyltransferase